VHFILRINISQLQGKNKCFIHPQQKKKSPMTKILLSLLPFIILTYNLFAQGDLYYPFGQGGHIELDVQGTFDIVGGLTERPDGNYLVASYSGENLIANDYVIVSCIDTLGLACPLFGTNGHTVFSPSHGVNFVFPYIHNTEDNSVIVAWRSGDPLNEMVFAKLDNNGDPDQSFGDNGFQTVISTLLEGYFSPTEFVKNPNGGFLVIGNIFQVDTYLHPAILFLTETCEPNNNVGVNGLVQYEEFDSLYLSCLIVNSENEILTGGFKRLTENEKAPVLMKCDMSGNIITSFGANGLLSYENEEYPPNSSVVRMKEFVNNYGYTLLMFSPETSGIARITQACEYIPAFGMTGEFDGFHEFAGSFPGDFTNSLCQQDDGYILSYHDGGGSEVVVTKVFYGGDMNNEYYITEAISNDLLENVSALFPQIYLLEDGHILGGFTRSGSFHLHLFEITNTVNETNAVDDNPTTATIEIYPNPFDDLISINPNGDCNIQVYSADGTLVYSTSLTKGTKQLSTANWSPGVYYLQITFSDSSFHTRLIKN
jgi:Secretion system C-terminal sorting domain